ncbi:MAG: hypothetical protein J6Y68_05345 [Clostridia bacterium]|nr:hypothetical protein [Clostridia bacterium]MBP5592655.1 hypothetical protein [Clostridia bacterium]MBP5648705.1 hypothetical protein [Clostridia bacterium]
MINEENIYDSTIYEDFSDLPEDIKKKLFNEYLDLNKNEKKLLRIIRYVTLGSLLVILSLLISAIVISIVKGLVLSVFIISGAAILVLGSYIIFSFKSEKLRVEMLRRFANWLKVEKHIIATLKIDMK